MTGHCGLDPDINKCQYYIKDKGECNANNTICGFFEQQEKENNTSFQRKPRWYEQYYKDK